MDYDEWITRERKTRIKLLSQFPSIQRNRIFSVCHDCGEIIICHEKACPNCNSGTIVKEKIDDVDCELTRLN